MRATWRLSAVRPLVRYVDEEQAVIDTHLTTFPSMPGAVGSADSPLVEVLVEIHGSDGFHDEGQTSLRLVHGQGSVRFEVVHPQRWWPAGMGDQPLYELTVSLAIDDEIVDRQTITLGFTSIRRDETDEASGEPRLLVNGQVCVIHSIINVDRIDETQLLPAAGNSILLVRDHYGPEVLYQAADRAGILLVQCVPIHPAGTPEIDVAAQVDRLSAHPSLAGWFVGHLGQLSDEVARQIQTLDPTRSVFREFPTATPAPAM